MLREKKLVTINISKKHLDMNRKKGVFYDKIKIWIKCLMAEKNTIAAVFKLGCTAIGYISSVFAFSVLLKDLIGFTTAENLCKRY